MKYSITFLAVLLLSTTSYADKGKKTDKPQQPPQRKQEAVMEQSDTTAIKMDFGLRMYDPRMGRYFHIDPADHKKQ